MLVDYLIKNCQPVQDSWFWGLLKMQFGDKIEIVVQRNIPFRNVPAKVIFLDDEGCLELGPSAFDSLQGSLIITQNINRHRELLARNLQSIYWPWMHWFFHLIPLRRMGVLPQKSAPSDRVFNFLNRRWHPGRQRLISYMLNTEPKFFEHGFITSGEIGSYRTRSELEKDVEFTDFYKDRGRYYESNNTTLHGIDCSVIIQNFFHIADRIPGIISIQVESGWSDQIYFTDMTEKSMIGFVTQQIPIVIARDPGRISLLKSQGFDAFEDIIDHSYDDEKDYEKRLLSCIDLNHAVLLNKTKLPDIGHRLKQNQIFLVNGWTDRVLGGLLENIEKFLSKEKTSES